MLSLAAVLLALLVAPPLAAQDSPTLPAPLYALDYDGQLWRLDADGVTLSAINTPDWPVADFDVSPVDGRLALLAGNDLFLADADGKDRALLLDGPQPEASGGLDPTSTISGPRWSPDGARIAYGMGGVRLLDLASGEEQMLLANAVNEDESDPLIRMLSSTIYTVESWSPDGARLLVNALLPPESAALVVIDVKSGETRTLFGPCGFGCGYARWSADSSAVYRAVGNPNFDTGLWRIDAATGAEETLIPGSEGALRSMVAFPQALSDGSLLLFMARADSPDFDQLPALTMTRAGADGVSGRAALREDTYLVANALWAPDGSGAVIVSGDGCDEYCPWLWLPADGGAALPLPVRARYVLALRWGHAD